MINHVLWMLSYHRREGFDVKEDVKSYIESKKFNVNNTVRDINTIFKIMYERSNEHRVLSHHQWNYDPELKL